MYVLRICALSQGLVLPHKFSSILVITQIIINAWIYYTITKTHETPTTMGKWHRYVQCQAGTPMHSCLALDDGTPLHMRRTMHSFYSSLLSDSESDSPACACTTKSLSRQCKSRYFRKAGDDHSPACKISQSGAHKYRIC